ncbi:hypothetical protein FRB93_012482 [Tulasnella sp. JGI-2019a]|nr:hypothetical protein FRB93_012482 [Tulasnella sp. JGI-2019a]
MVTKRRECNVPTPTPGEVPSDPDQDGTNDGQSAKKKSRIRLLLSEGDSGSETERIKAERVHNIIGRLLEAGYDRCDIDMILREPLVDKAEEVTDARWKRLRTKLTKLVTEVKERRLEEDRRNIISNRRAVAS